MASVLILSNIRVFDDAGMATGPGLRAWGIAAALAARGHDATLAEPLPEGKPAARAPREGVRLAGWRRGDAGLRQFGDRAEGGVVQPAPPPPLALARLRETRPHATVVFVGAENPMEPSASIPGVPEARAAARELGLLSLHVHFAPWQPYDTRAAIYQESDLAVLTHRPLLEAQLSWRT